jgi:hypothetical protein
MTDTCPLCGNEQDNPRLGYSTIEHSWTCQHPFHDPPSFNELSAKQGGDRMYDCLALFDRRKGTELDDIVRACREGWERSAMGESRAWDEFDRLMIAYRDRQFELALSQAT